MVRLMSKADSPSDDPRDEPTTAQDVYDEYEHAVDAMAERDDEIGAIMRAVQRAGGDADGE